MIYLPIVVLVFLGAMIVILQKRETAKFDERFPPIDDDEFVRRCSPGVNRDIALRVRRIVSEQLGIEYERIYPEQKFVDDLYCD
jgi:hypothetical protein